MLKPNCKIANKDVDEKNDLLHIYVGLLAYKMFKQAKGHAPGVSVTYEPQLQQIAQQLLQDAGYTTVFEETSNVLNEIIRAGGAELHNLASLLGGIGAQEVVKIITHQYVLLDNMVIFDGIKSTSQTWRL